MDEERKRKRRINRKRVVLIEWTVLILVFLLLLGGGILLLRRMMKRSESIQQESKQQESRQPEKGQPESIQQETAPGMDPAPAETGSTGDPEQEVSETGTPERRNYIFSFAGDCTIGGLLEWESGIGIDFLSVVGEDYAYPLSGVREIFAADDLTTVNLEGTFTTSNDAVEKPYRFRADPSYVRVLSEGSVEAVSVANNHSGDFREAGFNDTLAALDTAGILHTGPGAPLIRKLDGGLTVGIVSYNTVDNYEGEAAWRSSVKADIDACKAAGCGLIIGFMHWGSVEYLPEPEAWEVQFAHDMADWGCDLIVGGHAHILQRMEYYNDVPIFYSLGNFCYGGNTDPDDKDSVIVQAEYTWDGSSAEAVRTGLRVIPCEISTRKDLNDYCPTPCEEGSEDYRRILEKLEWTAGDEGTG